MNKCLLQLWEEAEKGKEINSDGCSIHIDYLSLENYIKDIYKGRDINNVPDRYDRKVGNHLICFISDNLYEKLLIKKSIKLFEVEKNNLISTEEIIINDKIL